MELCNTRDRGDRKPGGGTRRPLASELDSTDGAVGVEVPSDLDLALTVGEWFEADAADRNTSGSL
jgi:hypothetical protein